ncbi:DUF763 domain-containing protein [Caldivirga sp. UBA161]|uniref:DUF763 domain-containing protein n=1 Tax=Caldivirga sp. UBA161 TaxID=1915569 RepID=UPI0025C5A285|nr:DUF763 domain-containing protein [Caldivirga sp. UBA161]
MGLTGFADLPLHEGHVPPWLFSRMIKLTSLIIRLMHDEYGVKGAIRLFSNPIFFQSFNNIIGMDWDSSGSTTVTTAALKEALGSLNIGIKVVGGKGEYALRVPDELRELEKRFNINSEELITASRLVAKVDNVALQDGHRLYHHSMIVGEDGTWAVIQQGLNPETKYARRYHWWMETSFINNPHEGIVGVKSNYALNTVSSVSEEARSTIVDIVNQDSVKVIRDLAKVKSILRGYGNKSILSYISDANYEPPSYYNPRLNIIVNRGLSISEEALRNARGTDSFRNLLLVKGMGPSTMLALALIAQLIYEVPVDWTDPVNLDPRRFAFALGGKDGSPYPISKEIYDTVIDLLNRVVDNINKDSGLKPYLKHIAKVAKKLNLPVDLVKPTY